MKTSWKSSRLICKCSNFALFCCQVSNSFPHIWRGLIIDVFLCLQADGHITGVGGGGGGGGGEGLISGSLRYLHWGSLLSTKIFSVLFNFLCNCWHLWSIGATCFLSLMSWIVIFDPITQCIIIFSQDNNNIGQQCKVSDQILLRTLKCVFNVLLIC